MKTRIFKTLISFCVAGFISLAANMTVQAAPVTMADGNLFDAAFYAATYPDVAAIFGTDPNMLYMHYVLCGKTEGRLPYAAGTTAQATSGMITLPDGTLFDPVFYATVYPDVAAVFGTDPAMLANHYLLCGKAEGRLPYGGTAPVAQTPAATGSVPGTYNGMVITKANWYTVPLNTMIDMGNYLYVVYDDRVYPNSGAARQAFLPTAENILISRYPQLNTPIHYANGYHQNNAVLSDPATSVYLRVSGPVDKHLTFMVFYGCYHSGIPGITAPSFIQYQK